jgi:hypothetical protein
MKAKRIPPGKLLQGTRVYLSGPMDFVASRELESKYGWRTRVGEFLRSMGAIVLDPWNKPEVRGLHEYGKEGANTTEARKLWSFARTRKGAEARAYCSGKFWETLHIDLRMVDKSDVVVAYCPTNVYSVGTPHEIALCRQQRKPVLFVSPPVVFPSFSQLQEHLSGDRVGRTLLEQLATEVPLKENPDGLPSLWYMPLVGPDHFFDGFGFAPYRRRFRWQRTALDDREAGRRLKNPLLPFLEGLSRRLPRKWDNKRKRYVRNDDWILWDEG